jgi:hypothetical protein
MHLISARRRIAAAALIRAGTAMTAGLPSAGAQIPPVEGSQNPIDPSSILSVCANADIVGTNGPNVLNGGPGRDIIDARGGADTINGRGGNDVICAGNGSDVVNAGSDNDHVYAGDGNYEVEGGRGDDIRPPTAASARPRRCSSCAGGVPRRRHWRSRSPPPRSCARGRSCTRSSCSHSAAGSTSRPARSPTRPLKRRPA